jgi:hypothetical protein
MSRSTKSLVPSRTSQCLWAGVSRDRLAILHHSVSPLLVPPGRKSGRTFGALDRSRFAPTSPHKLMAHGARPAAQSSRKRVPCDLRVSPGSDVGSMDRSVCAEFAVVGRDENDVAGFSHQRNRTLPCDGSPPPEPIASWSSEVIPLTHGARPHTLRPRRSRELSARHAPGRSSRIVPKTSAASGT